MNEILKMVKYLKVHSKETVYSILIIIGSTVTMVFLPLAYKNIVDRGIMQRNLSNIAYNLLLVVLLILLKEGFNLFQTIISSDIRQKVFSEIRFDVYRHLQEMSLNFYSKKQTGSLISRIVNDVDALEHLMTEKFVFLLRDFFIVSAIISIIFFFSYKFALLSLLFIPIFALVFRTFKKTVYNMGKKVVEKQENLMGNLQETIAGVETIQSYDTSKSKLKEVNHRIADTEKTKKLLYIRRALAQSSSVSISIFSMVLLWGYGGYEVLEGRLSMGVLIAISYYANNLIEYITDAFNIIINMQIALPSVRRIFDMLDTEPEIKDRENAVELYNPKGDILFENTCFSYEKGRYILKDVNLSCSANTFIGIVGESGQGKTSFVKLIQRFYDPVSGNIFLDGINLKNIKIECLRRHIAMINQETFIFNASIKENILVSRGNIPMERVIWAAKIADVHDFIISLPEGYDTIVGERGMGLSGGQKKKIAIARAVLLDSKIIILDEATADLDEFSEKSVLNCIKEISKDKVIFMITHKLSNLSFADRILAVSNSKILEYKSLQEYRAFLESTAS
ncbi:ABC transporter ATP-binding protein [Anaerobacterium chartisolvens]|uniref:ABC transporter ATP-binding protein n=1 Tax=Anaerobacterium chartisolvens TaxID=1297424 RepID=UPI001473E037|nr:ABC transporter ATP-binding protein [Anaerobacterium chartisolvens]